MPAVSRSSGWRFHFYSDEGTEPPHIHVAVGDAECEFWLDPVELAHDWGVDAATVRKIERIVFERQDFFLEKWRDFHGKTG